MEKIKKASPKFRTIFLGRQPPSSRKIAALIRWCGIFHRQDLTPSYGAGSYGNLSLRTGKGRKDFLITLSGIRAKNRLSAKKFFRVTAVNFGKKTVTGFGAADPSSEAMLHAAIYRKRKDVNAVFHGHCPGILDRAGDLDLPQTDKEEAYGTIRLVRQVLKNLGRRKFLVMKNHGFVSLGKNASEAGCRALGVWSRCQKIGNRA